MEKDLVLATILGAITFVSLGLLWGYVIGTNKYDEYYYYYISQYPSMETINKPQDLLNTSGQIDL